MTDDAPTHPGEGLDLEKWFEEIMLFGQEKELMGPVELGLKMYEEGGEVAEAILYQEGWLRHKEPKDPIEEEIADVLMLMLAAFGKLYPDTPPGLLLLHLKAAFIKKFDKYQRVIVANRDAND